METSKGHMHQTRKKLKSTETKELKPPEEEPTKTLLQRTNTVFTKIIKHKRKIATYLTGNSQQHQTGETIIYLFYMIMKEIAYSSDQ